MRAEVEHDPLHGLEQLCDAEIVVRQQVAQLLGDVAATPPPDLAEIGAIGDPEVLERHEESLIDGLPQPQLDCDPATEPGRDVLAIEPLWGSGQP